METNERISEEEPVVIEVLLHPNAALIFENPEDEQSIYERIVALENDLQGFVSWTEDYLP